MVISNNTSSAGVFALASQVQSFIEQSLEKVGLPSADATKVASLMAEADMQGSDGHGAIRLTQYIKRIKSGGMNIRPNIRIATERSAMAIMDGDNGMGHLVVSKAVDLAIKKAKVAGVAWVGTRNSNHAGPASLYVRKPLEHDMLGLYFAVGNANHLPPWGGVDMLLSTNPIAAGIPTQIEPAVILDMATTVTAYGKVKAAAKRGEQMPVGWMIDRQGKPLLDPARANEGFLLPIGGHKGYGLALIVGLLAGTLNGAAMGKDVIDFNQDYVTKTNTGQAILVIDLKAFGDPAVFKSAVDTVVQDLRNSKRLPGVERIWLPGEQSQLRRAKYEISGVPISAGLLADLNQLAVELGVKPIELIQKK